MPRVFLLRSIENVSCWAKTSSGIGDAVITRVYLPPSGHLADTKKPSTFSICMAEMASGCGCLGFDGTQMAALITGGETNKHKHSGFSFYSAFFFSFCFSLVGGRNGVDAKHARYYYVHSSVGNEWRFSFFLCLSVFWLNHYSSLIVSISYSSKNNFIIFCFWNCSWF